MILECRQVNKSFVSDAGTLPILNDISFSVLEADTLSIVGPSGSGKTTLLALCAGLDDATSGEILFEGKSFAEMNENERAYIRNRKIGFVFQSFHLIASLSALENVMVSLELSGDREAKSKSLELLERVGLQHRVNHLPAQMSGGEQQRVAIARAFANRPALVFADEPTGNLDEETSHMIEQLLFDMNKEFQTALVLVTHNLNLANRTARSVTLSGGRMIDRVPTP